ncbi:MAG: VPDSG-CTERM sorting domain-containing protein [Verrucomicrobia bacterium]|nr:VPDSG-CTERM sorting domain-containing protein [Verrucomicrobiota bacterium]
MKTTQKLLALAAILVGFVSSANADTLVLSQDLTHYSVGNGGAFIISSFTGPLTLANYNAKAKGDGGFLTFCLEENEYFNPGYTYNYSLSFGAKNGGVSGQTAYHYDGVSNATAWLYSQFATGALTAGGFSYTHANLGDLQQAVWYLEGEGGTNNYLVTAAKAHEGVNWNSDNNGKYGVMAVNINYLNGANSQDQLYFRGVPDGGATLALLGLSLLTFVGLRRKFGRN